MHPAADGPRPRPHRQDGAECECPCDRTDHDGRLLASSKVAIDASVATAARTHGQRDRRAGALAQPHPQVDDRFELQPLPAPARAPARWTGDRPATTAARRAPARSATSAAAVTTTPSSSTGVRRTAACAQKPAIAARSAPPHTRSSANGIRRQCREHDTARRGPPPSCVTSPRRRYRCPGRRPRPARHRSGRRSKWLPPLCFRCPCRRRSADPRRNRPPRRRSGGPPRPRRAPRRRSARPRRRCCRCPVAPCARRSTAECGSSTSTAMSTTRTLAPAASASTLIAAPPASKLATICAVTSAGNADTPADGDAVITGEHHHPRPLELARRAHALARRHPDRQLLEPAQRAGRLGQRVLPGPACGRDVLRRAPRSAGKSVTRAPSP